MICSGIPPGCTPMLQPAAARRSRQRPLTDRAFNSNRTSRKIGNRKSSGDTPGYQESGEAVTVCSPQYINAIVVKTPCGCQTTSYCLPTTSGSGGGLTCMLFPLTADSNHDKNRATTTANHRGPQGFVRASSDVVERHHTRYTITTVSVARWRLATADTQLRYELEGGNKSSMGCNVSRKPSRQRLSENAFYLRSATRAFLFKLGLFAVSVGLKVLLTLWCPSVVVVSIQAGNRFSTEGFTVFGVESYLILDWPFVSPCRS
mmetsp:Transcript_521/g.963  ORF Transcript_521/g.963 Transcript_521/m.963 type:complete len:261 (-) Transcript_521:92-874(-)